MRLLIRICLHVINIQNISAVGKSFLVGKFIKFKQVKAKNGLIKSLEVYDILSFHVLTANEINGCIGINFRPSQIHVQQQFSIRTSSHLTVNSFSHKVLGNMKSWHVPAGFLHTR